MKLAAGMAALTLAVPTLAGRDPTGLGVGYICAAEARPAIVGGELTIVGGMGSGGFPADTKSAEAQAWFDYGLKLYHGFYHDEAKVAFRKAAEADPRCALCVWGEALSLGPTLNFDVSDAEKAKALALADRAAKLAKTDAVRELAATLQARYQPGLKPIPRELAYGRALAALAPQFPGAEDIPELAAQALLTPARADDDSGVKEALALLEPILKRAPHDTAAIHYYIHATEIAGKAELALPYAEKLARLAPEASHLVHMGGHTLFRVGRYEDVAVLNAAAMKTDSEFGATEGLKGPISAPRYYLHNTGFGLAGALMSGDGVLAVRYAEHAPVAFPAGSPADRRTTALGRSYVAFGRYAPAKALAIPQAGNDEGYLAITRHYARGEAYAQKGDAAAVLAEAAAVRSVKALPAQPGSQNLQSLAAAVLDGRAAMLRRDPEAAIKSFEPAARLQEKIYAHDWDPPPWWYPIRRSLAAAELAAGRPAEAAKDARVTLAHWPGDPLALQVLAQAEAKLGRTADADDHRRRARSAWRGQGAMPGIALI